MPVKHAVLETIMQCASLPLGAARAGVWIDVQEVCESYSATQGFLRKSNEESQ